MKHYVVGGWVRDRLLGVDSKDIDYAVEAPDFASMVAWIREGGHQVYLEKPEHFTARVHLKGTKIAADFVLCRRDGPYSDGRRPDWVRPGTILDDLARRDFTVNAMAAPVDISVWPYPLTEDLVDPHGGKVDIDHRRLRTVGDPMDRFTEDALRVLRALRFRVTKKMSWSPDLWESLWNERLPALVAAISADRRRDELRRCFEHDSMYTMHLLRDYMPTPVAEAAMKDIWLEPTSKARRGNHA